MQRSTSMVGAALVALAAGCGARTGLETFGAGPGSSPDAGVDADAALDGPCACPAGQSCVDGGCVATGPSGVVVLGWEGVSAPNFLSSTWGWDGTSWTQKDVASPQPARDNASMARLNGVAVLFGGSALAPASGLLGETWTYDDHSWTQRSVGSGPINRESAAMATLGDTVVLFGGITSKGANDETWTWNGATWTKLDVPGPSARGKPAMATLGDEAILFGGKNESIAVRGGTMFGDTWTWDGSRWKQLDVQGPSARAGASMAMLDGKLVLYGGLDASGTTLGDTWTWDGTAWTQLAVAGPITPHGLFPMPNLVATLDGAVVFYAAAQSGDSSATWTWDGASWTMLAAVGPNLLEGPYQSAAMSAW
ncbi:MAG TPA: hypothetical protein VGG39_01505 [Polyangiaceae bacterium]|jgi:hypothetical protein